jgi:Stress responsive A/B Barrel Domain
MIVHTVEFRWNDSVTDAALDDLEDALREFVQLVSGVRSYRFGRNLNLRPGTADFALVAYFERPEDVSAYLDHPAHIALVKRCIDPILKERTTVHFEAGPDYLAAV